MNVQQTPPAALEAGDERRTFEQRREQVKRDLEAAIAETQAEIARLEALLAAKVGPDEAARLLYATHTTPPDEHWHGQPDLSAAAPAESEAGE